MTDFRRPERIAVLGRAGSGKTTATVALGETLGLPTFHLDRAFWTADWQPVAVEAFEAQQRDWIDRDRWIIDGGYMASVGFPDRMTRAELIVITDAPLVVCVARVVRRTWRSRHRARADRPDGADERLSPGFFVWMVQWGRRYRRLADDIAAMAPGTPMVRVKDRVDLERLCTRLARAHPATGDSPLGPP